MPAQPRGNRQLDTSALVPAEKLPLSHIGPRTTAALAPSHCARLLPLLSLPLAIVRVRGLARAATGPEHNALLAATAQLLLVHGALFAVGLAIA